MTALIRTRNQCNRKLLFDQVYGNSSDSTKRYLDILQPKNTSSWLTCYPSKEHDLYFNREEFVDALCIRYGWPMKNLPRTCECGTENSTDHALICKLGGFVIMRHNAIRDLEAEFLDMVCNDVQIEPHLMPVIDGNGFDRGANLDENARLDVSCRGFWAPLRKSYFDVRVTHPNAPSNQTRNLQSLLSSHEAAKKKEYGQRVRDIEHASFTPLVFATNGAMGEETTRYHQALAELLADKTKCSYAETMAYLRKRLSGTILRTALIALRGKRRRTPQPSAPVANVHMNLAIHDF